MLQLISRRFLRELDEAPGGNNLQYILKCPCIPFFGNQGLHNEFVLGGNGGTPESCVRDPLTSSISVYVLRSHCSLLLLSVSCGAMPSNLLKDYCDY